MPEAGAPQSVHLFVPMLGRKPKSGYTRGRQGPGQPGGHIGRAMTQGFRIGFTLWCGLLALGGCGAGDTAAPLLGPGRAIELVRLDEPGPPKGPEGQCWASDTTPAVIETVTEQVVVAEESRDEAGTVLTPASFETKTFQRMVQDREVVWFRAPCAEEMTVTFVATLQRALKARGIYLQAVTGEMDAATSDAIRRFQAPRGLDSPTLSLAAAKDLGISATDQTDL